MCTQYASRERRGKVISTMITLCYPSAVARQKRQRRSIQAAQPISRAHSSV